MVIYLHAFETLSTYFFLNPQTKVQLQKVPYVGFITVHGVNTNVSFKQIRNFLYRVNAIFILGFPLTRKDGIHLEHVPRTIPAMLHLILSPSPHVR